MISYSHLTRLSKITIRSFCHWCCRGSDSHARDEFPFALRGPAAQELRWEQKKSICSPEEMDVWLSAGWKGGSFRVFDLCSLFLHDWWFCPCSWRLFPTHSSSHACVFYQAVPRGCSEGLGHSDFVATSELLALHSQACLQGSALLVNFTYSPFFTCTCLQEAQLAGSPHTNPLFLRLRTWDHSSAICCSALRT